MQGVLRIALPDGLETLLFPALLARLRAEAPGLQLRAQLLEIDQQLQALDSDEVDLVVTAAPLSLQAWHNRQAAGHTGFCAVYSPQQVNLPSAPALAALAAVPQLAAVALPADLGIDIELVWHRRQQQHAPLRYLCQLVADSIARRVPLA